MGSEEDLLERWSKRFNDPATLFKPTADAVIGMNMLSADLYGELVSSYGGDIDLPELYVDGLEEEQIYEEIKIIKAFHDPSMDAPILTGEKLAAENESDDSGADDDNEDGTEEDSNEEEEVDEESNDSGNEDAGVKAKKPSPVANRREKSEVDDEFFNRDEMEKFLDEQDAKGNEGGGGDINYFDEVLSDDDDDEDGGLFDGNESGSDDDLKLELENDDGGDGDYDDDDDDDEKVDDDKAAKDLKYDDYFGEESEEVAEASDEEDMEVEEEGEAAQPEEIAVVNDKPWQMRGETTAGARDINTLLEEVAQFDHASRPKPQITDEFTFDLESIIKRRIQDKALDSVERKIKQVKDPLAFKKKVVLDSEKSKLSLNEIYEKEYLQQANKDKEEEEDSNHVDIRSMMRSLFTQLDAMSDSSYKPSAPTPEIKVVSNLPAVNMEDVQPVTHSSSQLLAPEEVFEKKELVANEEKTKEERKRDHRKKKIRQKVRAQEREKKLTKLAETSDKAKSLLAMKQLEKSSKLPSSSTTIIKDNGEKQSRSSKSFFTQLQQNEQAAKKQGKKRKLM